MSEMLEKILSDDNIKTAYKRVYANKGAGGVDGVTINELEEYLKEHWKSIKGEIQERKYKPQPVLRVEIPKPNGGVRKLGIPTVIDRVIEQAITQILTPMFEPIFSENSYGFRPNRRCEQAILKLLEYFNDGYVWVVDIDLEKFFDNVPQDKLMSYVGRVIHDIDISNTLYKLLKVFNIELLDHIIVSEEDYISMVKLEVIDMNYDNEKIKLLDNTLLIEENALLKENIKELTDKLQKYEQEVQEDEEEFE